VRLDVLDDAKWNGDLLLCMTGAGQGGSTGRAPEFCH
jgi:hypothetical protein